MAGRRSQRTATISMPRALLSELRPARDALLREHRKLHPTGDTYRAMSAVVDAIHALAAQLGHPDHYRDDLHRTPPSGGGHLR